MLDKLINVCFSTAIICVFLAKFSPKLQFLLKYGKTLPKTNTETSQLSFLHKLYVPKSWFTHFYVLDFFLSLTNLIIIISGNSIYTLISPSRISQFVPTQLTELMLGEPAEKITKLQFLAVSLLSLAQGTRRTYECLYVSKFYKKSMIHLSHYLVGWFFYTSINLMPLLSYHPDSNSNEDTVKMSIIRLVLAFIAYSWSSLDQFRNHKHLAHLVKYNRPQRGLFKYVCCAHYFDEIIVYFSYALILGTKYSMLILAWVIVDLGISANETYKFYVLQEGRVDEKKGKGSKEPKAPSFGRIVPFVY
ncbi:unnamed protein product [Ambrosiozyma monospora]|uniref:Polyprenal reductase n=1 Tax=Ambrosiozyma monospora TaxID=43982 RepID=A0A9W6YV88_AMBMO|nr:unnamed protein product [Ambrosiozyma monospora]